MKIDVEGVETKVIEGSRRVLSEYHPWVIIEFHSVYMSNEEKLNNWKKITAEAKKIIFISGNEEKYSYGDLLTNIPDDNRFYVFLQY